MLRLWRPAFFVALVAAPAAAQSGLAALDCDRPLLGNACLVYTCADCVERPLGALHAFSITVSEAELASRGFVGCTVRDLNTAVDLRLLVSRGANPVLLAMGSSLTRRTLTTDPCGANAVHAVFDDEAAGPPDACPPTGRIRPAESLALVEGLLDGGVARTWILNAALTGPKTAGTLEGWGIAADVQCATTPTSPCVADATTACLGGGRFRVEVGYRTVTDSGAGRARRLTGDTGWFWFFGANNLEIVLKVLDGCGLNGRHWVFASGLTDVGVTITVTDTSTGVRKVYESVPGNAFQPLYDTAAFACP